MKVIFLRLDKIGDLIATLPVDQLPWLKEKGIQTQWVIAKGLGSIAQLAEPKRQFIELDLQDPKKSRQELTHYLKAEKPDAVVVFYAPWWVGAACMLAGVPLRVTRKSQWHSFVFYNRALRQSRSLAEKHEADYNRELVEFAFDQPAGSTPFLKLDPPIKRQLFEKYALKSGEYFIVHPGMAGSALNWPQAHYNILIEKLINAGPVVITGTPSDDPYLTEIRPQWENHPQVRWLQNQLSMDDLLSLLKTARGVVAPSTGVAHLAAAVGTPVVGIYSPIRVHKATRWGIRGEKAVALTPKVDCPAGEKCWGERCPHFLCMEQITVNDVIKHLGL
ncbi:MAG: glycosyltransferase family 9 protein [Pseudobdellovibrionaceae bacterium]